MKVIIKIADFIFAIYFFVLANFYFWVYLFSSILSMSHLEDNKQEIVSALINTLLAPFMVYESIILIGNEKNKYKFGYIILLTAWLSAQIYRFFFVTELRLEQTDLFNLLFFGIPLFLLWITSKVNLRLPWNN